MKRTKTIAVLALSLVTLGTTQLLADQTGTPQKVAKTTSTKVEHMQLSVTGAAASDRADIEKYAREEGATHASLNVQTGELKISVPEGKKFDRDGFAKKVSERYPSVSVK